jgi:hypothetical protein
MDPNAMHPFMQVVGVGAAILPMAVLGVVLTMPWRRRPAAELTKPAKPPASEA